MTVILEVTPVVAYLTIPLGVGFLLHIWTT
jgi:hypothetical protein